MRGTSIVAVVLAVVLMLAPTFLASTFNFLAPRQPAKLSFDTADLLSEESMPGTSMKFSELTVQVDSKTGKTWTQLLQETDNPTDVLWDMVYSQPDREERKLHRVLNSWNDVDIVTRTFEALSWRCDISIGEKHCRYLLSPIRQFIKTGFPDLVEHTSYKIRRSAISKSEVPVLHIYMTEGAINKLKKKREAAISKDVAILFSSDDDWVRAKLIADDGESQKITTARVRLKGDWMDHIEDPKKLSFRIKILNGQTVFGMSKFSIQDPKTRNNETEALAFDMHRLIGVLSPRYFFVDVKVNGRSVGIMALEEHFTREMVESQNRREGPIVAVDEDWLWRQWDLDGASTESNLGLRDYPIKVFRPGQYLWKESKSEIIIRASAMLRDVIDGTLPGDKVFDIDLVSRWWIMTNIFGSPHAARFHNRRFYFNPVTQRLEPIPFDNMVASGNSESIYLDFAAAVLLDNEKFRQATITNIAIIRRLIGSQEFSIWLSTEQERYHDVLSLDDDNLTFDPITPTELLQRLLSFSQRLDFLFSKNIGDELGENNLLANSDLSFFEAEGFIGNSDDPLYFTHLRPFRFWSPDGTEIELKNLTAHPITVDSVFFRKRPERNVLPMEITVPFYQKGSTDHVIQTTIDATEFDLSDQMQIRYSYQGQEFTKPVILQFRYYDSGYEGQETTRAWLENSGALLDQAAKTITLPSGHYSLTTSFEIERGWQVELHPGAVLEFKHGARLKVNGPVQAFGRKDVPVQLIITSDTKRGLIGSWGGLLVVEADRGSIFRHTHVTGTGTYGFSERQDSYGLTGCITFYKSSVRIEHSRFSGLQCEDALNVIDSDFDIDRVEFVDSSADAFDSDFSSGVVRNSVFRNIVNDGIDVSGSRVQVSSSRFVNIRDKAISVGEGSTLTASEIAVEGGDAGVVSKDKSVVNIHNSTFKGVNNALMAYVKKEEWGPATIHCDNCVFDHVEFATVEQYASRITIDDSEVSPRPFSRKQLQIAGYIQ
jgi:hypothetical protein